MDNLKASIGDMLKEKMARRGKTMVPARLDAEGTARPLTRIVSHPKAHWCVGPGSRLVEPEYEAADGTRVPLT